MQYHVKEEWGRALVSGAYDQRSRYLEAGGEFDVAGVLCHLASKRGVVVRVPLQRGTVLYRGSDGRGSEVYLPPAVQAWSGLPEIPMVWLGGALLPLSALNDRGWTFPHLWGIIRDQL